jgi:hypothetical protein
MLKNHYKSLPELIIPIDGRRSSTIVTCVDAVVKYAGNI